MWKPGDPQEEQSILLAAQKDPSRFGTLYERYAPRVYAYCLNRVNHPQDAEDLTSQIFVRALTSLPLYRGGLVGAWVFGIANHVILDHIRAKTAHASFDIGSVPDDSEHLLDQVLRNDEQVVLHRIISTLPADQQQMLALRLFAELSAEEVGAVVGKSAGAVRVAVHRILNYVAETYHQLEKEGSRVQN